MSDAMELDIIREVINIGMGDAAMALSELVKERVIIQTPDIRIMDVKKVSDHINNQMKQLGVYIAQDFEGLVKGKSLLFYTKECSLSLLKMLQPNFVRTSSLSAGDFATLQEIGNIIMVSCTTTISEMMEGTLQFFMPTVSLEISDIYFRNLLKEMETFDKIIVVKNEMAIAENKIRNVTERIEGYLFVLLSFHDFRKVVATLERKLQTQ